ncbi:FtsH protease activity modulator HflK [Candidatus Entotheonella serta]|nr:FtsH protease activity modulator HflK [Candidatus Entotheonella serta]
MRGNGDDPVRDFLQDANFPRLPRGVLLGIVVVLVGLSMLWTVFYQVEPDEVAVVQRFGRYQRQTDPGLNFKWPFGLEIVTKVKAQRVLKEEFGFRTEQAGVRTRFSPREYPEESLMLTGDLNVADVKWIVQYRISDPVKFLFGNRNPRKALMDASQIAMRTTVGDYTVTEVLTERRLEVANEVQQKLQTLLDLYDTGLRVVTVKMQNVTPPSDEVKRAFNEVNEAQQEKERKINEARQEYNQKVPLARGEAERTIAQAEGAKINRVNSAKGDVARFTALLAEYNKAPDVTRRRLYLETMREILPSVGQMYIFDKDQSSSLLPFLDLKRGGSGLPLAPQKEH